MAIPQTNCMHFHWTSPRGLRVLKTDCVLVSLFFFFIKTRVEALILNPKEDFRDGEAEDKKHLL